MQQAHYRKVKAESFYIANVLKPHSYLSLQSALSWYGLIPEFVPVVTSVSTARPQSIETPLGKFEYRHISKDYFWGYQQLELANKQTAFVARPEKALLDLVYLTPGGDTAYKFCGWHKLKTCLRSRRTTAFGELVIIWSVVLFLGINKLLSMASKAAPVNSGWTLM